MTSGVPRSIRFGEGNISPDKYIVWVADTTTLGMVEPVIQNISTRKYQGYIKTRELADTNWVCKTAIKIVRRSPQVLRAFATSNSEEYMLPLGDTPTKDRLTSKSHWEAQFLPWKDATVEEKYALRYVPPWQPCCLTARQYDIMLNLIKECLYDLDFPDCTYVDWPKKLDCHSFNRETSYQRPFLGTGVDAPLFGPCYFGQLGLESPADCFEHQRLYSLKHHHPTLDGHLEWMDAVKTSEPDQLLRQFDVRYRANGHRATLNEKLEPSHIFPFWDKYPNEVPYFAYQYGTVEGPIRKNYTREYFL